MEIKSSKFSRQNKPMIASQIAFCTIPSFSRNNSWHSPRITCIKNRNAPRFLTTSVGVYKLSQISLARHPLRPPSGRVQVTGGAPTTTTTTTELVSAWDDEYGGVIIDPARLPSCANAFASQLRASLGAWRSKGKKGIWLKLFEEQAELVPIAIKEGFVYHDAEGGYVMLTYWIPNEPCLLPRGPSHQIGIAAFVLNNKNQVLVVKEKKCSCICSGIWKLPTGFIDKSEELFSGAVREVKEETGIATEFLELVAFRHVHRVAFEKSDLLFVCMLKPLSFDIQIDEDEIQDAKWITVDELLSQQFYKEDEMLKRVMEICMATYEKNYNGFVAHRVVSKFDGKMSSLYYRDVTN